MSSLASLTEYVTEHAADCFQFESYAQVVESVGLLVEAEGVKVSLGSICYLAVEPFTPLEVVGFDGDRCFLMPLVATTGIRPGTLIKIPAQVLDQNHSVSRLPSTHELLGRVVDGLCRPIDGLGDFKDVSYYPDTSNINPLARSPIDERIDLGVGSINALLTVGRGQRLGLFTGSGVGKSVLLGMLARFVEADVVVVGLIGERGREVQEFIRENLGSG